MHVIVYINTLSTTSHGVCVWNYTAMASSTSLLFSVFTFFSFLFLASSSKDNTPATITIPLTSTFTNKPSIEPLLFLQHLAFHPCPEPINWNMGRPAHSHKFLFFLIVMEVTASLSASALLHKNSPSWWTQEVK